MRRNCMKRAVTRVVRLKGAFEFREIEEGNLDGVDERKRSLSKKLKRMRGATFFRRSIEVHCWRFSVCGLLDDGLVGN